jgi:hypothetical protein
MIMVICVYRLLFICFYLLLGINCLSPLATHQRAMDTSDMKEGNNHVKMTKARKRKPKQMKRKIHQQVDRRGVKRPGQMN